MAEPGWRTTFFLLCAYKDPRYLPATGISPGRFQNPAVYINFHAQGIYFRAQGIRFSCAWI